MDSKTVLTVCPDEEYFGRSGVIEELYLHGNGPIRPPFGIYLVGKRWVGKTEVLKRVYHRFFREQGQIIPFYYRFKPFISTEEFIVDYLHNFARQYLAFIERDPSVMGETFPMGRLARTLRDRGGLELSRFLALYRRGGGSGGLNAVGHALTAPVKTAALHGARVLLILDDFHHAARIYLHEGGKSVMGEYMRLLMSEPILYIASGYTDKITGDGIFPGALKSMELAGLGGEPSRELLEGMCRRLSIGYDGDVLSVVAKQLEGNPAYMKSIAGAVSQRGGRGFASVKEFITLYVDEVVEGSITLSLASAVTLRSLNALRLLALSIQSRSITVEDLRAYEICGRDEMRRALDELCDLSLLEIDCGLVRWIGDGVMEDYITSLYETRLEGKTIAEVKARLALKKLKEGYILQAEEVGGDIAGEARELLGKFNGQKVSPLLFSNQDFLARNDDKGGESGGDGQALTLPHIAGCSSRTEGGYAIISAHGFNGGAYNEENEVTWLVGVKVSPAAIHLGDVESIVRRFGTVRGMSGSTVVKWVIGREGFTGEALKRMKVEGAFTTDGRQLALLREMLSGNEAALRDGVIGIPASLKEFEIILPMSGRAELVAARAVEEVGGEMGFERETTDQIKTALVEACINAFEHSKVKHGKVYCRFVVARDRLTVSIRNSGRDFDWDLPSKDEPVVKLAGSAGRGRGITLMRQLMDEVRFEKVRDGTKLVMTKYLKSSGEERDEHMQ